MLDRRTFLRRLGFGTVAAAAAATGALDVERLLWVPGEKTIFLPPPPTIMALGDTLHVGDIFTIEGRYAVNPSTYRVTKHLQQFIVTKTATAGGILTVDMIHPPPRFSDISSMKNSPDSPARRNASAEEKSRTQSGTASRGVD